MQAIILTEVFTRYRGRKTNVKLSRQFDQLYSRVSLHSSFKRDLTCYIELEGNPMISVKPLDPMAGLLGKTHFLAMLPT
jgi:hypothetical protein